jgi:hypothetical protein
MGWGAPCTLRRLIAYTLRYAKLVAEHPWAQRYGDGTGSQAIWLAENIGPLTKWREGLTRQQLFDWVTPRIVREHYEHMTKGSAPKPDKVGQDNVLLQTEINRLKRENAELTSALAARESWWTIVMGEDVESGRRGTRSRNS